MVISENQDKLALTCTYVDTKTMDMCTATDSTWCAASCLFSRMVKENIQKMREKQREKSKCASERAERKNQDWKKKRK